MRGPSLAIILASLIPTIGCTDATSTTTDVAPATSGTPAAGTPSTPSAPLPTPVASVIPTSGPLGERVLPIKLPAVKGDAATAFRFGRENERAAWIATIPERAQLVSVSYGGGKIFVGGGLGSNNMYALDAKTGKRLWTASNLVDPGPTTAVYDDGELAFNTYSCTVEVHDAETGKTLWTKWIGSETPNQPAIVGNLVLATHPSESGGFALSAYKRKTGNDVWSASIDGHIFGAPIVSGDSAYVTTATGAIYRIGLDGKRLWRQDVNATSAPWIDGTEIHVAVRSGKQESQIVLDAATGKQLRTALAIKASGYGPGGDPTTVWGYEGPRPVVRDGVSYSAMGNMVEARDVKTNAVKWWREKPKGEVSSVIVVGPLAIVTSKTGELIALDRETGAQRLAFDFKTSINAQPIVADGWMYVATNAGQVLAFEIGAPNVMDGWHQWGGNAQHNL